jgi:uncharacterized membrane protein (DUF4010 family)
MPELEALFARFGLALVLGFLIGLERERDKPLVFAGMRTFALISLLGAAAAFISESFTGPWLFVAGFAAMAAFATVSHMQGFEAGQIGITTEVALLLCYLLGAMVYWDQLTLAAAATVGIVLVLNFKPDLQEFLTHVDRQDIWAGLEFAIVTVIVLPVLPNRTYGPLNVLNPREIWLMVVFVTGINLAGYILSQVYSARRSIGLTGLLGGMVSSTAVTFEFARRSAGEGERGFHVLFALAIAIASTGMFFRAVVLAAVINPSLGLALIPTMAVGAVVSALGVYLLWRRTGVQEDMEAPPGRDRRSPFALWPAIQFGIVFAAVLWVSRALQVTLGNAGVYISSVAGGVAGMDAVTLSMAKLSGADLAQPIAVRAVALGAASNMLFKGGIAAVLGSAELRKVLLPVFTLTAAIVAVAAFLLT